MPNHNPPRLVEIENIFKAHPCTISQLLNVPGRCFFVPPYQRDFDWNNQNIKKFFDDVCHGWSQLEREELAATFLGSIIAVLSSSREDFSVDAQQTLPAAVSAVVDGQQRLTTLLMTCVAVHNTLRKLSERIARSTDDGDIWIRDLVANILSELLPMIEQQQAGGEQPYIYYPRLIRRPEDQWGTRSRNARYHSPIARLLNSYSALVRKNSIDVFHPDLPKDYSAGLKAHKALVSAYKYVRKCVGQIAKGEITKFEVPLIALVAESTQMQYALTGAEFPPVVRERLVTAQKNEREGKKDAVAKLIRLSLFSRYLCRRVAVTLINAMNEEYAFDIFECLNTTGEPLTAYQTFKPKVVGSVGVMEWESSSEKKRLDIVEEYLRTFQNPQTKQKKTAELLTTFALFECGHKLPHRLSEQRQWMQKRYEDLLGRESEQAEFIRGLSTVASFMEHVWPSDPKAISGVELNEPLLDTARLCLGVLRQAQHTIAIPLIARFYGDWRRAPNEMKQRAAEELVGSIKAVTAFWVLWRLSRRSTGGIDDFYRLIMSQGFARSRLNPDDDPRSLDVDGIRREFTAKLLEHGVGSRLAWIRAVTRVPAYQNETAATRFALLAAMHDSVPDPSAAGLWTTGRTSTFEALKYSIWSAESTATIEHIAPQTKNAGPDWDWPEDLYQEEDTVNLLGNLVLCPRDTNASLGNQTGRYKFAVYRVLASTRSDEFDEAMAGVVADEIELKPSAKQFLGEHKHLRQMQAFNGFRGAWDKAFVLERTENLAGLAWDRLAPWLGLSETNDVGGDAQAAAMVSDDQNGDADSDEDLFADDSTT